MSCKHDHEDAAYVLGALSPHDRATFERHLPGCPACAHAVAELAGLPGLLARVPLDQVDPDPVVAPVPETLLPALVRRVRHDRRRRAVRTFALVGVAATIALAAVGLEISRDTGGGAEPSARPTATSSTAGTDPGGPDVAQAVAMRSVGNDAVSATVSLTPVSWGTRLELTCDERGEASSGDALPAAWSSYAMFVHTRAGRVKQVATWRALPGQVVRVSGATSISRSNIVEVEVRNAAGVPVLDLAD